LLEVVEVVEIVQEEVVLAVIELLLVLQVEAHLLNQN
jgi:hypothetical protein